MAEAPKAGEALAKVDNAFKLAAQAVGTLVTMVVLKKGVRSQVADALAKLREAVAILETI